MGLLASIVFSSNCLSAPWIATWGWGVKAVWQQFTWAAGRSRVLVVLHGVQWVICMVMWMWWGTGTGPGPHTCFTITPFLLAAELVCRVVVSVVHQAELPREHVHSVPDKKVVGLEAVVSRPPQEYSLVLHIKLLQTRRMRKQIRLT